MIRITVTTPKTAQQAREGIVHVAQALAVAHAEHLKRWLAAESGDQRDLAWRDVEACMRGQMAMAEIEMCLYNQEIRERNLAEQPVASETIQIPRET